jgi:hypothetical protein
LQRKLFPLKIKPNNSYARGPRNKYAKQESEWEQCHTVECSKYVDVGKRELLSWFVFGHNKYITLPLHPQPWGVSPSRLTPKRIGFWGKGFSRNFFRERSCLWAGPSWGNNHMMRWMRNSWEVDEIYPSCDWFLADQRMRSSWLWTSPSQDEI